MAPPVKRDRGMQMRRIVGAIVVMGALLVPGSADAALLRDAARTVITTVKPTAESCSSPGIGYTECTSSYGPVTSTCGEGYGLGFSTSSCTLSVASVGAGCESSMYGSSRGSGDSAGCFVLAGDTKVGCADSSQTYIEEQRSLDCAVGDRGVSVPLDPALP